MPSRTNDKHILRNPVNFENIYYGYSQVAKISVIFFAFAFSQLIIWQPEPPIRSHIQQGITFIPLEPLTLLHYFCTTAGQQPLHQTDPWTARLEVGFAHFIGIVRLSSGFNTEDGSKPMSCGGGNKKKKLFWEVPPLRTTFTKVSQNLEWLYFRSYVHFTVNCSSCLSIKWVNQLVL